MAGVAITTTSQMQSFHYVSSVVIIQTWGQRCTLYCTHTCTYTHKAKCDISILYLQRIACALHLRNPRPPRVFRRAKSTAGESTVEARPEEKMEFEGEKMGENSRKNGKVWWRKERIWMRNRWNVQTTTAKMADSKNRTGANS